MTMTTYRRTLSPNELYERLDILGCSPELIVAFHRSYFLPSRAYGLNDMYSRIGFRAPPALVTPLRVCIGYAILRLQHSLMACRVEMAPGCYDDAQFVYTPPSSPEEALNEARAHVGFHHGVTGPELTNRFLNGPRQLTSDCLARMDVACEGPVRPGIHEFSILLTAHHMINDTLAIQESFNLMFEMLGGSSTPGGPPRTDAELATLLDREWARRWKVSRDTDDVIVPATESRLLGIPRSKLCQAAWRVDNQNIQQRFVGGQTFPRIKSSVAKTRFIRAKFNVDQTRAIYAKCKSKGITLQSAFFALANFAWIHLCSKHPEINAPKTLPMLMYTAVSTRRYLKPKSELSSFVSLALDFTNVVLPSFLPSSASPNAMFWARSRAAQKQVFAYSHSPLFIHRSVITGELRAERAKVWARLDDEADGTLPAQAIPSPSTRAPTTKPPPALIGISQSGDNSARFRRERYPKIELFEGCGGARKAPGGMLLYSRTFLDQFTVMLTWDAPAFAPGLVEEFWEYVVDGVHEYVLEDPSLVGTAEVDDCLASKPPRASGKL